jgi:dolichol-phosphate mannosyltransferase
MKDIVLMPTYNERENVEKIISEIFNIVPEIYIKIIDDDSPDKTADVVKELMVKYPHLSILERPKKDGFGNAYKDAMREALKDKDMHSVITIDADGSHAPKYLLEFLANINNYDLVIGSRYTAGGGTKNWGWKRRMISRYGNLYARLLTGLLRINDLSSGFMCVKREILEKVNFDEIKSSGFFFLAEFKFYLIKKLKARAMEVPIIFLDRVEGKTKFSRKIMVEGLKTPWRLFFERIRQQ